MRISMFLMAAAVSITAAATTFNLGFAPGNATLEQTTAHGTGMNNFIEGVVKLDLLNPAVSSMKGGKIVGIKCFMRQNYKQKSKGFSSVVVYKGSLDSEPTRQLVNLSEGWNEVTLDEPVVIGEENIYVGARVFEMKNAPYPFVSFKYSHVPGSNYINTDNQGFEDYSSRGALLIQAIVEKDGEVKPYAFADVSEAPSVLAPHQRFDAQLYVHNLTSEPISKVGLAVDDGQIETPYTYEVTFDEPIKQGDGVVLPHDFIAPPFEGLSRPLGFYIYKINDEEGDIFGHFPFTQLNLYVTSDAFVRIPVVEEFTSLPCVNCPMMFYYLDQALRQCEKPVIYLSRHSGFVEDEFTTDADRELIYLFGPPNSSYNPAVMYDRRVFDNTGIPVFGAKVAEVEPYAEKIAQCYDYPGLAQVLVDCDRSGDNVKTRVYGKLSKIVLPELDKVRISTYLVEDDLPEWEHPQKGVSIDPIDGAPSDLAEIYRHNGIVRHMLNASPQGDKLEVDENGNFSVTYDAFTYDPEWVKENCKVVSMVYFYDPSSLSDNYVLNAGSENLNNYVQGVGVKEIEARTHNLVKVTSSRTLEFASDVTSAQVYDLSGRQQSAHQSLHPGIYLVRCNTLLGASAVKVVVR